MFFLVETCGLVVASLLFITAVVPESVLRRRKRSSWRQSDATEAPLVGIVFPGILLPGTPLAVAVTVDGRVRVMATGNRVVGLETQHHPAPILVEQRYTVARVVDRFLDGSAAGDVVARATPALFALVVVPRLSLASLARRTLPVDAHSSHPASVLVRQEVDVDEHVAFVVDELVRRHVVRA